MASERGELILDLAEALKLLQCAGPNPLSIEPSEYWERVHRIFGKYGLIEQSGDGGDVLAEGYKQRIDPEGE